MITPHDDGPAEDQGINPPPASLRLLFTGFRPIITITTPADQALLDERAAIRASIIAKRGMPPAKPNATATASDTEQQHLIPPRSI